MRNGDGTAGDALVARIRERLHGYFPGRDPGGRVDVVERRSFAYSTVWYLSAEAPDGRRHDIVAKVFPHAARQYRALQAVWDRFGSHPTWKVARPLDLLEIGPTLVMEAASGTALQRRLPHLARGARLARAADDCRRTGAWLRFFHQPCVRDETRPLDTARRMREAVDGLRHLHAHGLRGAADALARALDTLAPRLADRTFPIAAVHGEFTVDNVLIDGDRVTVLDLWGEHRHVVYNDLGSFLNSLRLARLVRPGLTGAGVSRLEAAFLDGYFGTDGYDLDALGFVRCTGLIDAALEILGRRRSPLAKAWLARVIGDAIPSMSRGRVGVR